MKFPIDVDDLQSRVRHPRYADAIKNEIRAVYAANERSKAAVARMTEENAKNPHLSDLGKKARIEAYVLGDGIRSLVDAAKTYRSGKSQLFGERKHMGVPTFDQQNLVAAMERQEIRTLLRSERDLHKRGMLALEMAKDKTAAEAILSGRSLQLTGLSQNQMNEVRSQYLGDFFAKDKADADGYDDNLAPLGTALDLAHMNLHAVSGLPRHQYDALVRNAEGPGSRRGLPELGTNPEAEKAVIQSTQIRQAAA